MLKPEIIVVGAGVAGLLAARELLRKGKKLIILEARNRVGGRIVSEIQDNVVLDGGPDFIHGGLPLTIQLLNEYRIGFSALSGDAVHLKDGKLSKDNPFEHGWDQLLAAMKALPEDMPFADFLNTHFDGGQHAYLRTNAAKYAEGFDVADTNTLSTKGLYAEWSKEEEMQYRIPAGYARLTDALAAEVQGYGSMVYLNKVVKKIEWSPGNVKVVAENGQCFEAPQVLITVPVGIWQAPKGTVEQIQFLPDIPEKFDAARRLGFGAATKILLQWRNSFWEPVAGKPRFLFGEGGVPTWWTHYPENDRLLTGWIGGPAAISYKSFNKEQLIQLALESLSKMTGININELKNLLVEATIFDWINDPFSRGSYSFPLANELHANAAFATPIQDTIFFAGEACYGGSHFGTVEAAIHSALSVVAPMLEAGFLVPNANR